MTTTTTYNSDGSYTVFTTDSSGDTTTQNYSAASVLQNDTWTLADGSSGGDTYAKVAFAKLYDRKTPITAADLVNDRVVPFYDARG